MRNMMPSLPILVPVFSILDVGLTLKKYYNDPKASQSHAVETFLQSSSGFC